MKLLLIAVLLLVVVDYGFSLECYTCTSEKNCDGVKSQCITPNPLCLKVDGKKDGEHVVLKLCTAKVKDLPFNTCVNGKNGDVEGTVCTCDKDLCNNANVKMISLYAIFVVTSIAALIQSV